MVRQDRGRRSIGTVGRHALLASLASGLLTLGLLIFTQRTAQAYVLLPCHYAPGTIDPLTYTYRGVGSAYVDAFETAAATWNATAVPGHLEPVATGAASQLIVRDGRYVGNYWAMTLIRCGPDQTYKGNRTRILFNTTTMDGLAPAEKALVAAHEMGHAYGLGHVDEGCHVMRQGTYKFSCGSSLPSSDDIAGVQAIYGP